MRTLHLAPIAALALALSPYAGGAMARADASQPVPPLTSAAPPPAPSPPSAPATAPAAASPSSAAPSSEDDGAEADENPYAPPAPPAAPGPSPHAPAAPRVALPSEGGMLLLPGGKFTMGSADRAAPPNERPPHAIVIAPFWIDRTEVTVAAYRACVERRACARPVKTSPACTYDLDDPELPMSCVHWAEADTFCRSRGKRLPREAEWEFAARGTHGFRYPWGGSQYGCALAATLVSDATGRTCTGRRPSRVGAHPGGASVFGIVDLSGNVEEWTSDWYAASVAEGSAPRAGASHVLRGGGWLSGPRASRTTSRNWGSSLEAGANVGFRCARDPSR